MKSAWKAFDQFCDNEKVKLIVKIVIRWAVVSLCIKTGKSKEVIYPNHQYILANIMTDDKQRIIIGQLKNKSWAFFIDID